MPAKYDKETRAMAVRLVSCWSVVGVLMACAGEDVESEVAAAFGSFVVLFGRDGTDESYDAGSVGEEPTSSVRLVTAWLGHYLHLLGLYGCLRRA